ncbi:hypothetical protein LX32DRAFT_294603 [Colletotrichum zoysiae]|uniref:Extracellular serine-rich protein n=1 Tax=Colletotrichum zoysiae TaxID=1216348 RepID=A0AAD9LWB7_9PEZI|nr:hypothetical protein LX32DRAFT_294603 [Colletotrichum zoysiae]
MFVFRWLLRLLWLLHPLASFCSSLDPTLSSRWEGIPTSTAVLTTPTHSIAVGADGFVFSPKVIANASIGDVLEFHFFPGGHSVARAEFEFPCIPYEYTGTNKKGFFSGTKHPQVVSYNELNFYRVRINDTSPLFFYCAVPGSCKDEHMIGAVNPNITQTFETQMQYTSNTSIELAPGDPFPSEVPHPTAESTVTPNKTLAAGQMIGIVVGAVAILLIVAGLAFFFCRHRRQRQISNATVGLLPNSNSQPNGASSQPASLASAISPLQGFDAANNQCLASSSDSPMVVRIQESIVPTIVQSPGAYQSCYTSPVELSSDQEPVSPKQGPNTPPPYDGHASWSRFDDGSIRNVR